MGMLNLSIRVIMIYFFLLVAMRLMGKRQLGELQPFELAITLIAADLACLPMNDQTIPILYGIIPIFVLFLVHILITKLASKSIIFRKLLNGLPVIVIDKGNMQCKNIKKLDMSTNDLLEAIRGNGYFTPAEIETAIVETNGKITVMPKFANKTVSNADLKIVGGKSELPYTIISEGKLLQKNLAKCGSNIPLERLYKMLSNIGLEQKDIYLLTLTGESVFMQPYNLPAINRSIAEVDSNENINCNGPSYPDLVSLKRATPPPDEDGDDI